MATTLIFSLVAPAQGDSPSSPAGIYQFAEQGQALAFHGKGWGHGVGLCQWGARGRANAGQSAEQI
ncbi:MAG TPA: hypothetical protein VGW38_20090, partial [Chloroflexota bacterium]|nr:hypothetical protein [Chloroflexota bacterium]